MTEHSATSVAWAHKMMREPIPLQPFLDWCEKREAEIARSLGTDTAVTNDPASYNPTTRLLRELGWEGEAGARRLFRWRHESLSGLVERAEVEDALDRADVLWWEVYPDLEPPHWSYVTRIGATRFMTDDELLAAHVVYVRGKLTMAQTAELIYVRFGYKNVNSAARCLHHGWQRLGLRRRECEATRTDGGRCQKPPLGGSEFCVQHDPRTVSGWTIPDALAQRARAMREAGASFRSIGAALVGETPWTHYVWAAQRFSDLAAAEGWQAKPRTLTKCKPEYQRNRAAA